MVDLKQLIEKNNSPTKTTIYNNYLCSPILTISNCNSQYVNVPEALLTFDGTQ